MPEQRVPGRFAEVQIEQRNDRLSVENRAVSNPRAPRLALIPCSHSLDDVFQVERLRYAARTDHLVHQGQGTQLAHPVTAKRVRLYRAELSC